MRPLTAAGRQASQEAVARKEAALPAPLSQGTPLQGAGQGSAARRWYSHGWNSALSWELILRIAPRLPRFVLIPLHHLMSLICLGCLRQERAATRRNLRRVTGRTGLANLRLAYRLFFNFGRFLFAYTEMRHLEPSQFEKRVMGGEETTTAVRSLMDEGRGLIIVTMHIGHWDLGLKLLSRFHVPVHVVMLSEDPVEVSRYADAARATPDLRVHKMGSTPLLAVELMAALKRGELVAIQADRPVGQNVMRIEFFGMKTELPTGPAQLAMATGAPILPIFVLLDEGRRYRLLSLEPLRFARPPRGEGASESALRDAMGGMTRMMESVVSRFPDQWFNFYDVWPAATTPRTPPSAGVLAPLRHLLFQQNTGTGRLSVAVGLGVFIGLTPFYFLHALLGIAAAWALRLNITATVLAVQVANPLFAPFLIMASVWMGDIMMGQPAEASGVAWWDPTRRGFLESWLRGGLALGVVLGTLCGLMTYLIVSRMRRQRSG